MLKRRQASLFLVDQFQIEAVRSRYNPIQARLIPAHVTLCREDEVCDWETLRSKLESLRPFEITLTFGIPVREGNFVYLPVVDGLDLYQDFRRRVLSKDARIQMPHLTLIHPRNGVCTDEIFADISATFLAPFRYTFREILLIEQEDGSVWNVLSRVSASDE
jgi:2'-5' RNA ligase